MALKTLVKISGINNLTDARYCAGMGVDLLGFNIDQNSTDFIGFQKIEDIIQWLSGVQLVGEIGQQNLQSVSEYGFDFLEISNFHLLDETGNDTIANNIILKITLNQHSFITHYVGEIFEKYHHKVAYFLLENEEGHSLVIDKTTQEMLKTWCQKYAILLGFGITKDNVMALLNELQPKGIALQGGNEISPGLKDMDSLAEILEILEI
jgi:phosphoribosylanthranilate isomerase